MRAAKFFGTILLVAACGRVATAADVPDWLTETASLTLPAFTPETEAVVLLNEQNTRVGPNGTILTSCRRAVRVLRQKGIEEAARLVLANTYDTRIRSMAGWNVIADRKPMKVTMKGAIETGLAPDTLYADVNVEILVVPEVEVGSVVGFEWEEERTPTSLEDMFEFQGRIPVMRARYSLTVPPGWGMDPFWENWPPQEIRAAFPPSPSRTWEIEDIPAIGEEPRMPNSRGLAGRLLVRMKASSPDRRCLSSWAEVGAWYDTLSKSCRVPDQAIVRKAQELTAGAPDTLSKLRALAGFAQKEIRYVAIEIGIGGYEPHSAPSIFSNRYGDCKDKTTLLASLLRALGISSHYVLVHTDGGNLTAESPVSLYRFNHVVLAIRLPDEVREADLPALISHPKLGRLLIFDPTWPYSPLGRLPAYLQGNTALLVVEGGGELISLPLPPPEDNLLDRKGRFTLQADGTLEGEIQETRRGAIADETRSALLNSTDAERTRFMETFLANFFSGFVLLANEVKNLDDNSRDLLLDYRFRVPHYVKEAGGMLIVRPRVVGSKGAKLEARDERPRRYPINLSNTTEQRDEFVIELADGCRVEDLPPVSNIDSGFAVYQSTTEEKGRSIIYRRTYRLLQPVLPAARFADAVRFFRAMDADERQSVLLKK